MTAARIQRSRVLVTGGAGFIGSHLVDALLKRDPAEVLVIDNLSTGHRQNLEHSLTDKRVRFFTADILDAPTITPLFEGIDICFHLACRGVRHSLTHPYENQRVNAEGTMRVLEKSLAHGVGRFVYCSSSEVYGTAETTPMTERHPTRPSTVYGASKLAGEHYTLSYQESFGLPSVVVRPFNAYGPRSHHEGDSGEVIPKTIVRALNHRELIVFGKGTQTRDFTFVEDTVSGILTAAETDHLVGKTVNIGSGCELSINTLVRMIKDLVGATRSEVMHLEPRPADVLRLMADTRFMKESTGWRPRVSFEEGLLKTITYFRDHPMGFEMLLKEEIARSWEGQAVG